MCHVSQHIKKYYFVTGISEILGLGVLYIFCLYLFILALVALGKCEHFFCQKNKSLVFLSNEIMSFFVKEDICFMSLMKNVCIFLSMQHISSGRKKFLCSFNIILVCIITSLYFHVLIYCKNTNKRLVHVYICLC